MGLALNIDSCRGNYIESPGKWSTYDWAVSLHGLVIRALTQHWVQSPWGALYFSVIFLGDVQKNKQLFSIPCLAAKIKFYLVNATIFNEIQCSSANNKFYLANASVWTKQVYTQCLDVSINIYFVNATMFNEIQCSFANNKFLPC